MQFVDPDTGAIIRNYPRGTVQRILTDPAKALEAIGDLAVELRSVDIYAALAEVAR